MDITDAVQRVREASGDPLGMALATLDIVLPVYGQDLRPLIEAAAIPHWFTPAILAQLLGTNEATGHGHVEKLRQLPMVEAFAARGGWNVHEATRLAIRRDLFTRQPDRFHELSSAAANCFPGDSPHLVVETLYHRLLSNPLEAGAELKTLHDTWRDAGRVELLQALAQALDELLKVTPPPMPARARCLIYFASIHDERLPQNEIERRVREALRFLSAESDHVAEIDAHDLLGATLEAQGKLSLALSEFQAFKSIAQRLVQQDPDNANWQRELAVSQNKVGRIYRAQGQLAEALAEFLDSSNITQRLSQQSPDNADWQRDISIAHTYLGGIYKAQGRLAEALIEYQADLRIAQRLAEQDPDNLRWQHDLAISHKNVGDIYGAQNFPEEALVEYQASLSIMQRLVLLDSDNAQWQHDLSVLHNNTAVTYRAQGRPAEALERYQAASSIMQRLAEQDPDNVLWQRDLAMSYFNIGWLYEAQNQPAEARESYRLACTIMETLTNLDPERPEWQELLASIRASLSRLDNPEH